MVTREIMPIAIVVMVAAIRAVRMLVLQIEMFDTRGWALAMIAAYVGSIRPSFRARFGPGLALIGLHNRRNQSFPFALHSFRSLPIPRSPRISIGILR